MDKVVAVFEGRISIHRMYDAEGAFVGYEMRITDGNVHITSRGFHLDMLARESVATFLSAHLKEELGRV